MQFTGRLEAATGFRLQMRQLNDAPTPSAVASALRNIGYDSKGANRGSSIDRTDIHSVDRRLSSSLPASAASSNALTVVDPVSLPHASSAGTVRVDEIFFPTRDGTKLSARLWLPDGVALDADELRAPAVIEILPYGYATGTIDTDEATYPYLAGNGIACIRVDSRGSGNSEGVLDDEYSPQQQRDACDACEWAAAQPWCTGAVGMMGCSWGGFIALQVAALAGTPRARAPPGRRPASAPFARCAPLTSAPATTCTGWADRYSARTSRGARGSLTRSPRPRAGDVLRRHSVARPDLLRKHNPVHCRL